MRNGPREGDCVQLVHCVISGYLPACFAPLSTNLDAIQRHAMHMHTDSMTIRLPESPHQQYEDDQSQGSKRPVLLQQQLPVDPYRCSLILGRVFSQSTAHISHLLQAVSSIQQVFNVLCHYLRYIFELIVESAKVVGSTAVLIRLLGTFDEAIELAVRVWAELRVEVVFASVGRLEFGADVFEVGESELLGVAALGDGDVGYRVIQDVAGWCCRVSKQPFAPFNEARARP
jgi:hypothetical protein